VHEVHLKIFGLPRPLSVTLMHAFMTHVIIVATDCYCS